MTQDAPHILLIDSYDSFTHNLAALCQQSIPGCNVHIIRNDDYSIDQLTPILRHFSAIVVGPGPGSPMNDKDIGVVKDIWNLREDDMIPIFGVCLGLQSLVVEFGGALKRLNVVKHGQISRIDHLGLEIFEGVGEVEAVRYHSLHVEIDEGGDIEALAWANDGEENGRVLMAARHKTKPFWAVQYHPESVRTRGGGDNVLRNFWRLVNRWTSTRHRGLRPWSLQVQEMVSQWPIIAECPTLAPNPINTLVVNTSSVYTPNFSLMALCESLGVANEASDFVLLESAAQPGRFSIIGCPSPMSTKLTYRVGDPCIRSEDSNGVVSLEAMQSQDIWGRLNSFMGSRSASGGNPEVPFWGGFIGFLSYELGVDSLGAAVPQRQPVSSSDPHPDVNLVFVGRSIVYDSSAGCVHIQTIVPNDDAWIREMQSLLQTLERSFTNLPPATGVSRTRSDDPKIRSPSVVLPCKQTYIDRIKTAKEYLYSGDSYELCLTAPTRILVPKQPSQEGVSSSWELYKILREKNPAPHSAFIRLHPSTLISSSPERFLSYTRPPDSVCQLRPIKGTVRKGPGVTRAAAEQLLIGSKKEVAENLMIVDLIRHDLHGVVGEDVQTKQFCAVEEYETVWQLVSVIEGRVTPEVGVRGDACVGWEVLQRSLPPGSMTGAPKKRSVEILHSLEDQERSIYSGVFGYWCVGGSGDWSVTIRSCFKYDAQLSSSDPNQGPDLCSHDEWTLGAGGAITALSDPDDEWDEMVAKVESVLRAFGVTEDSSKL